jgi:hypothetical protein
MRPNELPPNVLRWSSAQEKGKLRRAWRLAVMKEHGAHNRLLRLAWAVFELAATKGFASAGDGYLAAETVLQLKNVQLGLTQLDRGCDRPGSRPRERGAQAAHISLKNYHQQAPRYPPG